MDIFDNIDMLFENDIIEITDILNPGRRKYTVKIHIDNMHVGSLRLSNTRAETFLMHIRNQLAYRTDKNNELIPLQQLLLTLRFLVSGRFYIAIADFEGIHKSTCGKIIERIVYTTAGLREYIQLPNNVEVRQATILQFSRITCFPQVLGAIDSAHNKLQSPVDTIIGIDLGTTNSCFGSYRNNRVELIEEEDGRYLLPSMVCFTDEDILIGTAAKDVSHMYMKRTAYDVKRFIGLPYSSIRADAERVSYEVVNNNGYPCIHIEGKEWLPEEISGLVLKNIIKLANSRLEVPIKKAVITVPAYFGTCQRDATKDAANLAGIEDVYIINEPTAAALAFQHDNGKDIERNLLIYDFGGGTFDVSIVKTKGKHCKVIAVGGDCHLGGIDITMKLFEYIKDDMKSKCGISVEEEETFLMNKKRILNSCEMIKEKLSSVKYYSWDLYFVGQYNINITRKLFETLTEDIFQKTLHIVEKCISDAKLTKNDIDIVVLVGGSTRIPRVRGMLAEYFGEHKINTSRNPDQMVAYGAVIYAQTLLGNNNVMTFEDVLSQSLGTDIEGDLFHKIIPRNTPIPVEKICKYTTVRDFQKQMTVRIYQGESAIASENTLLGQFIISNLTEELARKIVVEVSFCLNKEGILKVKAVELDTKNYKELEINIDKSHLINIQPYSKLLDDVTLNDRKAKVETMVNQTRKCKKFVLSNEKFLDKKKEFEKLYNFLLTTESIREEKKTSFLRKVYKYHIQIEKFDESMLSEMDAINKEIAEFIEKEVL